MYSFDCFIADDLGRPKPMMPAALKRLPVHSVAIFALLAVSVFHQRDLATLRSERAAPARRLLGLEILVRGS